MLYRKIVTIKLKRFWARFLVLGLMLLVCSALLRLVYQQFVVSTLTSPKRPVPLALLAATVDEYPTSARLHARYAEALLGQGMQDASTIWQAASVAEQAVNHSPFNAKYRLLLATAKSLTDGRDAQVTELRAAQALAPHDADIHWQLANALLRAGQTEQALAEFAVTVTANPALLPNTLTLLWQLSQGDLATVVTATGESTKNRLQLARFLLKQSREQEALDILHSIARNERLAAAEVGGFLNDLLAAGKMEAAHQLWAELVAPEEGTVPLLWNGGFETASPAGLSQFDWQLRGSEYAQLTLDTVIARSGAKSLRLDFFGRDTTRLRDEIKQLVVVRPGTKYRLTCYVRTAKFGSPEGPRLVVTTPNAAQVIAASSPITMASSEWQLYTTEFIVPAKTPVLLIGVQRIPKASYDEPTQGTIWFDDFALTPLF